MKTYCTIHAVAANGKGEYLILQRAQNRTSPDTWNFITGFIQERESAEEAALRELKEETNLEGEILKTTEPFWKDDGDTRWVVTSSLIKVNNLDQIKIDPVESQNFKWIKPTDPMVNTSEEMQMSFEKLGIGK